MPSLDVIRKELDLRQKLITGKKSSIPFSAGIVFLSRFNLTLHAIGEVQQLLHDKHWAQQRFVFKN